jgi:hypothetical protein
MKTTAAAVLAALISFLVGNVWIFIGADMFVQYFYETRMVALTHVFTLGWVSLMIVGVLRQLAPVAFRLNLKGVPVIGAAITTWIPAMVAMFIGFATRNYVLAATATSLLFLSIICVTTVFLLAFRKTRREPPHHHLFAALLYLAAAAVLGAWMGLAKGWDVPLPAAFHRVLFSHIHLAGAGWAGMMVLAVMSRLFPQPHLRRALQARIRFVAFNVGLVGLTVGLLSNGRWYPIFGSVLAVACIWYVFEFIPVLLEFWQPSDRSTAFLVVSWCCLGAVALLGLWLGIGSYTSTFQVQLEFVYGFVYFFGWLSFMIIGMLYRIIPTHVSKLLTARNAAATGVRRAFVDPNLQFAVFAALLLGLLISCTGILVEGARLFRFGWSIWMTGIFMFFVGLCRLGIEVRKVLRTKEQNLLAPNLPS